MPSFASAACAAMMVVASSALLVPSDAVRSHPVTSRTTAVGSVHVHVRAYATTRPPSLTMSLPFYLIADLDEESKDTNATKPTFFSYLQHGTLDVWTRASDSDDEEDAATTDIYKVRWGETERVTSPINDAGRGFELSELAWHDGKLLTVDDRTGIVFELTGFYADDEDGAPLQAIPQNIVMEGDGVSGKGQKHEWATEKDGELYLGSNGIVMTDEDGTVDDARAWVAVLGVDNDVRHVDWSENYARVRDAMGVKDPGYVTHEAVEWNAVHSKWFLLPRRVSHEAYNETVDAHRGANTLLVASEDFTEIDVVTIQGDSPGMLGFSSLKFVPGTDERVLMAIKSVEVDDTEGAFLTVFGIGGTVLLDDIRVPGDVKYEGLAFARD